MIRSFYNIWFGDFWKRIAAFGRDEFYLFVIVLFIAFGYFDLGIKLFLAIMISYFIVSILRLVFFRERPNKKEFNNILEKIDASSFPSKHSVRVSLMFVLVLLNFHNYILWGLFFVLMVLVCIGRLFLKRHYLLDVVFGVILGLIIGFLVNFALG